MQDEAQYVCDTCGEEITVPIDISAGPVQRYLEDCPVCCRPNALEVWRDDAGQWHISSRAE